MKIQFDDLLFEAWTQRFLFTMPEGGCEIGEIKATAARIPEGDRDSWYREWTATADQLANGRMCTTRIKRVVPSLRRSAPEPGKIIRGSRDTRSPSFRTRRRSNSHYSNGRARKRGTICKTAQPP